MGVNLGSWSVILCRSIQDLGNNQVSVVVYSDIIALVVVPVGNMIRIVTAQMFIPYGKVDKNVFLIPMIIAVAIRMKKRSILIMNRR